MSAFNRYIIPLSIAVAAMASTSCSTTRRIPADDQLYIGTKKIEYVTTDSESVPAEVQEVVDAATVAEPNNYISTIGWRHPFPIGLWVYNNWNDPGKGFKHWLYDLLVEEPVLISDVRPQARTGMIEQLMANNGFLRAKASYELLPAKNPRKAKIAYRINTGRVFMLDSIELLPDTTHLNHLIDSIARKDTYLQRGSRYSTDSLSVVRNRLTNDLRNRGYYFFRPEYIEYLADTVMNPGNIALRLVLDDNIPTYAKRKFITGDITVTVNRYRGQQTPDTVEMQPGLTLIQMMPSRLRRQVIPECVTFKPGRTFSVRDMNRTQSYLSRLGIFNSININAIPDTTAHRPTLNVRVDCTFDAPLEASIEVNASSKSNSYLGPGLTLGLTNHNVFGGGEQLNVQLTGAYEWQTGGNRSSLFNSYEFGVTGTLAFPRMLLPWFKFRSRSQLNWTRFTLNADLLNRPHYFKMAQFNASVSYDWRHRRHSVHTLTPLKLTYTNLLNTTAEFDSIMAENPAVALSFESQFIPQMIYSYTYDRKLDRKNAINLQLTVQEAGNIFWGIWQACGVKGEKHLFGTPFSQFVKGHIQAVWTRNLFGQHRIVTRMAVGAEHAYGNSAQVPYAEQFYCGGANSVRAFTVRSIGPGSYRAPSSESGDYFDQTGTFKFEANVEYRFPISGALQGAIFLDAGNVWLLKDDPMRPGGTLRGKSFFRDLATGTGLGIRFDIGMLVLRGDLGIGIHLPYDTGKSGYYNMESFGKSLAFHLAIGYPF